ncbi:MAG: SixA phosphatase family protein [Inquilinaceae bacterium]
MKRLFLLRHAKSGWDDPDLADHDRPLAPRGERAALVIGRYLAQEGYQADAVFCSTAQRAQETLDLVLGQWPGKPMVYPDRALYLPGSKALWTYVQGLDDSLESAVLVGHNPDFHKLAVALASQDEPALLNRLAAGLPTAGLVILDLPIDRWGDLAQGSARLVGFVTPKDLV